MTCRKCNGYKTIWEFGIEWYCWACGGTGLDNDLEAFRKRLRAEAAVDRAWEAG